MTQFYPAHSRYIENSNHYLWFSLLPKTLTYTGPFAEQNKTGNIGISAERKENAERFMFLAPEEIQDNVAHNWEPMENILSRVQEKVAQSQREIFMSSQQYKVDTALIYQDTNRREVSITIYLAVYDNPKKDIMEPINKLRELSSPSLKGKTTYDTKVGNPDIFKVDTVTGVGKIIPLINIEYAALTAVQPNFQAPYIEGYPSFCELTLTFKDMQPMSKETFRDVGSKVTVG